MSLAEKPAPAETDERLLRQHAQGDTYAFAQLLERHRQRVANLVRCRLGFNSLWVDDVAQDVFLQLHRTASRFEGRSTFKTWLFALTLNVCRDHVRRERRGGESLTIDDDKVLRRLMCESLSPLEELERSERDAIVRRAIAELTPTYRVVLQLRDCEDLTYEQIAEVLDIPVGTVRSRLHNARTALADSLAALLGRT
jgi:RNA polymerase sigma-70 factor (ECF subfamily)